MTWLSHQTPAELHRAWSIGGVHVCARCLGVYPVLLLGITLQFVMRAPLQLPGEVAAGLLLTLPAVLDWAYGRFRPHAGSNAWRSANGALLGMALARSLYVHFQRPWPPLLVAQAAVVTVVCVPVLFHLFLRARRRG